ncbi:MULTISPECIES: antA/AntB antirepressor family protein [Tenebrionibacter/Tenebrionicola group]|jgi:anti-repressor protein|uniref:AntA/AntB antirepressor family protein n=2 Tax=Tenebrionibacter/Tenebrionicola group TaxID=2969848 RepID=A0A8K0V3G1_9ENTR|nr:MULTISPECIES: antA/AntB antirepressor family protein [Tenebrionibacter/Tenebrionicola group]MBK4716392.1 antA/AntB antirepressor family protein [Tenebrionibacter intestinalis]MBV5096527.1 antA/AntB antirepressor family protein [Tenebrionicola larvae]
MKTSSSPLTGAGRSHAQNSRSLILSGEFADLIPVIPGQIGRHQTSVVSARALHTALDVGRDFTNWIKGRISRYQFTNGDDYCTVENLTSPVLASTKSRQRVAHDYLLTLDTAKEIAMVERNERGRAIRRYFIHCEEELQRLSPQTVRELRHQLKGRVMVASYHKPMCAALALQRATAGKPTHGHHYATEANLIARLVLDGMTASQWATANRLAGDPRDHMSGDQLELMAYLEQSNTTLIDTGMDYHQRKEHLARLVDKWRLRTKGADSASPLPEIHHD